MAHQIQRVRRQPIPSQFALPHDSIKEGIFVTADGEEFIVRYCGKMPTELWPEGRDMDKERMPAKIHLGRQR